MILSVTTGHLPEIDTKSLRADLVKMSSNQGVVQDDWPWHRAGGPDHHCGAYGPPPM